MSATTAAAQLRRLLQLIPHLADGETHSIAEVAQLADADARTIIRDIESIALRYDDPGGFVEGVQIFLEPDRLSLRTDHFRRPMRLTATELCALELGLAMLRLERPASEHPAIDRARTRLRDTLVKLAADRDLPDWRHAELTGSGSEHLAVLRDAWRSGRKVRIHYRKGGDTESSERVACPFAIVAASGAWYLIAHCELSEAMRIFRLDRIEGAEPTEETFRIPEGFSVEEVVASGRAFMGPAPERLRVRYSPRIARWIAEREGVALDADGSLTIEHPMGDTEWAIRHVLQYGPEAEVLAPLRVRKEIAARLGD